MKKYFLFAILFHLFATAQAFRIEYGKNVTINKPVYEDLYVAGGTVTINAPVYGDLVVAGGTIFINDTITNDILVAGGNVTFNGYAGDDLRCAGGNIQITKNVTGDVVITGGTVFIGKDVTIGGLLMSGGEITIDGNVNGAIKAVFGSMILNGSVAKNIDCRGGKISINGEVGGASILAARDIIIGNAASFNGDVHYWSRKEFVDFKKTIKNGKATYDNSLRISSREWYYLGSTTIVTMIWYLGMVLLLILIVQYLFSNTMARAAASALQHSLRSLAYGAIFIIAVPIAAIIAFITMIGVPVGILLLVGYIILLLLSTIIAAVVIANWFNNRNGHKWKNGRISFTAFGIFIILKLISLLPFAGWICMIFIVCISFGSILLNINLKNKTKYLVMKEPG